MKTRAELRAREDKIDAILNEVRNVTYVQKEIESKITGPGLESPTSVRAEAG